MEYPEYPHAEKTIPVIRFIGKQKGKRIFGTSPPYVGTVVAERTNVKAKTGSPSSRSLFHHDPFCLFLRPKVFI